jgi:hypothetical protein
VASALAFVVIAAILCIVAALAIFPITELYMARREALERDGLAPGVRVPRWTLSDSAGRAYHSKPARGFQLVMFTDHSLLSWESVADGLRNLRAEPNLEIVFLLDRHNDIAERVFTLLGLGDIPVLEGSRTLWARYNVRVSPFAIFVDDQGYARASSLVNHDWQLAKLWQIAQLPYDKLTARPHAERPGLMGT